MPDQDAKQHNLYALHRNAIPDNRDVPVCLYGTSSGDDDDGMHSSDANTSHVPSSCVHTTIRGSSPSTRDYAMLPMRRTRTNRRSQVYRYTPAR